jgi:Family of unknown function (DUF5681)
MSNEPNPPKRTVGRDGKSYPSSRRPKPSDETSDNARPMHKGGPWPKGVSGNPKGMPKGTRHHATRLAEQLIDDQGELLVKKCVEMALAGDAAAMRLVMERLCPPRRERPVNLSMPKINAASDLIAAASALTEAAADGEITPGEAASLSQLVANTAKAVETFELADRLARLEERISAKGSTP